MSSERAAGAWRSRLVSGIVLHLAAGLLIFAPAWFWLPLTLVGCWQLNREFARLLAPRYQVPSATGFGALVIAMTAVTALAGKPPAIVLGVQAVMLGLALLLALGRSLAVVPRVTAGDLGLLWFGILYLGWLPSFLPALRAMPGGQWLIVWVVGGAVLSDNAALLCGKLFGRRPLLPHVSPGKTLEGALGSLILTGAVLAVTGPLVGLPTLHALILGGLIAVTAQLGDLTASLLKRDAGVKDSGTLIPGHGGLLDRLDSTLGVGMVGYLYLALLAAL